MIIQSQFTVFISSHPKISEDGYLLVWGMGHMNQLGTGDQDDQFVPYKVNIEGERVSDISCGGTHVFATTGVNLKS